MTTLRRLGVCRRRIQPSDSSASTSVAAASAEAPGEDCRRCMLPLLQGLNDALHAHVLAFLPGWEAAKAQAALPVWGDLLADAEWWRSRCGLEFSSELSLEWAASGGVRFWRSKYIELRGASCGTAGAWCYRSRSHGLQDRVAQPQLFVGPRGQRLFLYGGWSPSGPQNDLHWVPMSEVASAAAVADPARVGAGGAEEDGEAARQRRASEGWRWEEAEARGRPAPPAGLQTLTPLWLGSDAVSEAFVEETAAELGAPRGEGSMLVVAFGGGQGSYRREDNNWAVGVLHEGRGDRAPRIFWGKPRPKLPPGEGGPPAEPTRRAAHTATYVPARLAGPDFPEGCVVVYGGHTGNVTRELASVDVLDLLTWRWLPGLVHEGRAPSPRHGHSATLVEVDGRGYIVVVGGGTRSILSGGEELSDAGVLDLQSWSWAGRVSLQRPRGVAPPGRHHSASAGLCGQILLFGGGHRPSNKFLALDGIGVVRAALRDGRMAAMPLREVSTRPDEEGLVPQNRKMHGAVCLLPWAPLCMIYGGWETGPHFPDLWVLALGRSHSDLEGYARLGGQAEEADSGSGDMQYPGGDELVFVHVMGPNGEVRSLPLQPQLLASLIQSGQLRTGRPPQGDTIRRQTNDEDEEEDD